MASWTVDRSRPALVRWAGWETTTARLQRDGWQIAAEHGWETDGRVRLFMKHRELDVEMWAQTVGGFHIMHRSPYIEDRVYENRMGDEYERYSTIFEVHHICCNFKIVTTPLESMDYERVNAKLGLEAVEVKSLDDFKLFGPPLVDTQEIIVEPDTVAALMDKIHAMQSTELEAIRDRNRRREHGEAVPFANYHAQIISLPRR